MKIALLSNEQNATGLQRVIEKYAAYLDCLYVFECEPVCPENFGNYVLFHYGEKDAYCFLEDYNIMLVLVYGWNYLVPKGIVTSFPCFNLHPSLLPKYRGPDPVAAQLAHKEKRMGVTLHRMNERLDTGPIWRQKEVRVDPTQEKLVYLKIAGAACKLADAFFAALIETGSDVEGLVLFTQNEEEASYFSYQNY